MVMKSLSNSTEEEICQGFNETFANYVIPMHLTFERFHSVATRRGVETLRKKRCENPRRKRVLHRSP